MWIFGRFLQCSAAGISQKRWGFVPSLGSSKLVNGELKVESNLQQSLWRAQAAMAWFMWLPMVALTVKIVFPGKGGFSWWLFWLLAGVSSHQQWPNWQGLFEGWWVANTRKSSSVESPFSRISKKRPNGRGNICRAIHLYRGFWKALPCITCFDSWLHMTWRYPTALKDEDLSPVRRSFHPVLQLPPFVVLVGNCHPLELQDSVMRFSNSQWHWFPCLFHQLFLPSIGKAAGEAELNNRCRVLVDMWGWWQLHWGMRSLQWLHPVVNVCTDSLHLDWNIIRKLRIFVVFLFCGSFFTLSWLNGHLFPNLYEVVKWWSGVHLVDLPLLLREKDSGTENCPKPIKTPTENLI